MLRSFCIFVFFVNKLIMLLTILNVNEYVNSIFYVKLLCLGTREIRTWYLVGFKYICTILLFSYSFYVHVCILTTLGSWSTIISISHIFKYKYKKNPIHVQTRIQKQFTLLGWTRELQPEKRSRMFWKGKHLLMYTQRVYSTLGMKGACNYM